ncbi:pikachurin-like [Amphiura filiformis]|uniref:pikachurin-like n=1 Tax=Amphiura filiformis TaxID=82378 RepID=UPI003B214FF0
MTPTLFDDNLLSFLVSIPTAIPRDIRINTLSSHSIMLEWQPVHHPALTAYVVYYTEDHNLQPTEWDRVLVEPKGPRPGVIVSSLEPDTVYYVTVSAYYSNGEGPTSQVHQIRTASNRVRPLRPPGEIGLNGGDLLPSPSQPRIDAVTATSVSLGWQPGSPDFVDYYTVEYFRTDTGVMQSVDVYDSTTYTVERLEPFTDYVFRVYPVNRAGRGRVVKRLELLLLNFTHSLTNLTQLGVLYLQIY